VPGTSVPGTSAFTPRRRPGAWHLSARHPILDGGTDVPWVGALVLAPGVLGIAFGARTRSLQRAEARAAQLELEQREAVVAERARIARELHDVIAHSVSVMTVQAGAAEEMLKRDPSARSSRCARCRRPAARRWSR